METGEAIFEALSGFGAQGLERVAGSKTKFLGQAGHPTLK